jgi:hypothetical protein
MEPVRSLQHVGLGIQAAHHGEERTVRRKSARSISKERTFQATGSWPQLEAICSKLAHALAEEMHANSLKAKTLTLKLKQSDFQVCQAKTFRGWVRP